MNTSPADTLKMLEGKTITKVEVHGVNSVTITTDDGRTYCIETEAVMPSLGVYGMVCTENRRSGAW